MSVIKSYIVPHPPMIIPEIGNGDEEKIRKTISSYEEIALDIADVKPDTIIISSPHAMAYSDYFNILDGEELKGDFGNFGAGSVSFTEKNDLELISKIEEIASSRGFPCSRVNNSNNNLDHGSMIPLYFIRKKYNDFKVIILGLSGLSLIEHYALGMLINDSINELDRRCVYIASGDLSHKLQEYGPYGFSKFGPEYDNKLINIFKDNNFLELLKMEDTYLDKASECGHRSFTIMSGLFDGLNVESKFYSHEDVTGVGYGIWSFISGDENTDRFFLDKYLTELESKIRKEVEESDNYAKFARTVINDYVIDGSAFYDRKLVDEELLNNRAGVFVSIHKFGQLRGCIGTISPIYDNICDEILNNAIEACSNDPRFNPVTQDELKFLEINVDVLSDAIDIDSMDELDPKKYGVVVYTDSKKGVLLSDLDGVDTVEEQIRIAKKKGNILEGEDFKIKKFEVIRHR